MTENISASNKKSFLSPLATSSLPIVLYLLGALWFFREQIFSRFDLMFGDPGDARAVAFFHEHVYRWFFNHSNFLSPPFFFNQTKTLGYSDAFLLDQIIYAPLRLLGAEPLLALSLVAVLLSAVAYLFVYLTLRRLKVSVPIASVVALLFVFPNNLYMKSGHLQHFVVYYLPIIAYCALLAVSELHVRPKRAYALGAFGAALYGLAFPTGYYVAWFFGLDLLLATPIFLFVAWPVVRPWCAKNVGAVITLGVLAAASFAAALAIFAIIYAPVLEAGMARNFGEFLYYAPRLSDLWNVGQHNLVWSGPVRFLHILNDQRLGFNELSIAITPAVQCLTLASGVFALCVRFWPNDDYSKVARAVVLACVGACVLFFLLILKVHERSLFHLLYEFFPGANAIRVGYRGMVVANLFAIIAIALCANRVFTPLAQHRTSRTMAGAAAVLILLIISVVEQANLARVTWLSRSANREHLSHLGKAPAQCRSFYLANEPDRPFYVVQTDAMMIALAQDIPTLNGHSGLEPPGWGLYHTEASDYEQRAVRWARDRGLLDLCRADLERGTWRLADWNLAGAYPRVRIGEQLDLRTAAKPAVLLSGWSQPEAFGTWTDGADAVIGFSLICDKPEGLSLEIALATWIGASISNPPPQTVDVVWNGTKIFGWVNNKGQTKLSHVGNVPNNVVACGQPNFVRLKIQSPQSLKSLGISQDPRALGIAVKSISINAAR